MDGLRWWLLIFGVIVVTGVYAYTRLQRKKAKDSPQQDLFDERKEPRLKSGRSEPVIADSYESPGDFDGDVDIQLDAPVSDGEPPPQQKIVTLRIIARNQGAFPGDDLVLSLRGIGMRHGKFGIFHRHEGNDENKVIFSAASLVEPGSFDLANIKEQEIPGISLFMVLPGPVEGAEGFDLMMAAARALAQTLDAELLDESGSTLSIQRERYMREEIIQFEHAPGIA
jgi:cell division protein ZipA